MEPARLSAESQLQALKNLGTRTPVSRITASGFEKPWNPHACQQNHNSKLENPWNPHACHQKSQCCKPKTLKPARLSAKNVQKASINIEKQIKTTRLSAKLVENRCATPRSWHSRGPALGMTSSTRTRSFASPARTHGTHGTKRKTKDETKPISRFGGVQSTSSPKPPIFPICNPKSS